MHQPVTNVDDREVHCGLPIAHDGEDCRALFAAVTGEIAGQVSFLAKRDLPPWSRVATPLTSLTMPHGSARSTRPLSISCPLGA
jgi:hypothetical protein